MILLFQAKNGSYCEVSILLHFVTYPSTISSHHVSHHCTNTGHANSFDAKRSLFDLDLLYKDLAQYGHDPHTHKYLGVTHLVSMPPPPNLDQYIFLVELVSPFSFSQLSTALFVSLANTVTFYTSVYNQAYVNDLVITRTPEGTEVVNFSADTMTTEIADHFQKGNYYCALRVNPNTIYDSEFREERWECMLQMALTASVLGYMGDAEKWWHAMSSTQANRAVCIR